MAQLEMLLRFAAAALLVNQMVVTIPPAHAGQKTNPVFARAALKRNYKLAAQTLEAAVRQGDADAMYRLGALYRLGLGVEQDLGRAKALFAASGRIGHRRAAEMSARLAKEPPAKTASAHGAANTGKMLPTVDPEGTDHNGNTWLARSAARGLADIVSALLNDQRGHDAMTYTALAAAVDSNASDVARVLLDPQPAGHQLDPNQLGLQLLQAAGSGNAQIVEALLAAGANGQMVDRQGRSALHYAAQHCNSGNFSLLMQYAVPAGPDASGLTPLHIAAAECADAAQIESLIEQQNVNVRDNAGRTPLWHAAARGNIATARHLIARGADPNTADDDRLSPLHLAAASGNTELIEILIASGADRAHVSRTGNTALMLAAANRCADCVIRLPMPRDVIDTKNQFGDTALILAVRARSPEVAQLLVAAGANPDARNARRDTARKIAERASDPDLIDAVAN